MKLVGVGVEARTEPGPEAALPWHCGPEVPLVRGGEGGLDREEAFTVYSASQQQVGLFPRPIVPQIFQICI